MHRFLFVFALSIALLPACRAQQPVERVVQAADKFLATLSETQRSKVMYDFNDTAQSARWSNFPTGFVPRGGISLKQMNADQRTAALDLMKTVLSADGYRKINEIRMADDDFKVNGSKRGPRGGGSPPGSGPPSGAGGQRTAFYCVRVFGFAAREHG